MGMPTKTTATTGQSDLPSGCAGCLQYIGVVGAGILVVIGIMLAAPDSLPDSGDLSSIARYGMMVSDEQNTCLEVRLESCEECTPRLGQVMNLYYTQLGGWFQSTKRVLLYTQEEYEDSDKVQFAKVNNTPASPIKVWIPDNVRGNGSGSFIFNPPVTFERAESMKPITQLAHPPSDNKKAR